MIDNYLHEDAKIIYTIENIPGPIEHNQEYEELVTDFNSQLMHNCNCFVKCLPETCKCLQISGGINYNSDFIHQYKIITYRLHKTKNVNAYPIFECNENCKCSEQCGNRLVQNGPLQTLYVKHTENELKGFGLFTKCFIRKGSFVCEYAGEVITRSQAQYRHQSNKLQGKMNYILCLNEHVGGKIVQTFVDPANFGNIGRYINHSCEPNCEIVPVRVNSPIVKLALFSRVDICPNMEITFNYGVHDINYSDSVNPARKSCLCNSIHCKGFLPDLPF